MSLPKPTITVGFLFGILFSLIFMVMFWGIATASEDASKAYKTMMCDYIPV